MREGVWSILATIAQIAAALVGAFAVYYATAQGERQEKQDANIQTLTLFATFNSESMLDIRNRIDSEEWCARWQPHLHERTRGPNRLTREQLTWFIDFFDAVDTCGARGVCNTELNNQLFRSYAYTNYEPIAEAIVRGRERNASFGQGLANLAGFEGDPADAAQAYIARECAVPTAPPASVAE